jgi:hypothetical protein
MNDFETKQAIVAELKKFSSSPLGEAASGLLGVLGYTSKKRLALKPNTLATFLATFSQGHSINERYALPKEWKSVDFLFQITDEEIRAAANMQFEFDSKEAFDGAIINSYLFIAIELNGEHYSRSALAGITREVNKLFDMPALIFFRHGETITLAVINRRLHKREPGKDVLQKVTLIQDIRLTNTHRAHIEILSDLSLTALHQKYPFTNFVGLHEAWQKTLDTSELNKRFFQDLANWYFWALPQVRFPKNAPKDADGQDSMSLIRLITRVIFCWFLKEKGLLPSALFDEYKIPELLVDLNPKESTYYKAILQNLFFATLNQEMGKREFRKTNQNFMAHNVYRYRSLLKSPNDLLNLMAQIPFMNGGLFECLDDTLGTKENPKYIRIDGFSDRDDNALKIPNSLFWGPEQVVDLSEAYGENKYSSSRVAGLVRIFDHYKFTVAENTPLDEEVALDPELLGKVFENLLASYNPETGATARKQTGSFYTPREIVNYMVDESLISSLSTQLKVALPKAAQVEERLRQLVAYSDEPHQFAEHEVNALIYTIDHLKILDPACGSGAFPMGILHKLVYVLTKLDPGNQRWKDRQLAKANEIPDSTVRERVVSDIEQSFNANELDYGRKLYLIENCIYGVDIQPIAVQISKLRFFISLVVEQNVNSRAENLGIRPLPNLETKFVAANSLICLERPGQQLLRNLEIDSKEEELHRVRERHFLARTPTTKAKCREQDAKLRGEIAELLRRDGWDSTTARKLAEWDPYDQNASASFFDTEWMFGITEGFDVVIGNPPYVRVHKQDAEQKQVLRQLYLSPMGDFDIYIVFMELSLRILKENGLLTFITPDKFLIRDYGKGIRQIILANRIVELYDISRADDAFGAAVYPLISIVQKSRDVSNTRIRFAKSIRNMNQPQNEYLYPQANWQASNMIELVQESDLKLLTKVFNGSMTVLDVVGNDAMFCGTPRARDYYEWAAGLVEKDTKKTPKVIVCSNISPYCIDHRKQVRTLGKKITSPFFDNSTGLIGGNLWSSFQHTPKILIRGNDTRITAVLDNSPSVFIGVYGIKLGRSTSRIGKFLVASLNSTLYQWIFLTKNPSLRIGGGFFSLNSPQLLSLPYKPPSDDILEKVNRAHDEIVTLKARDSTAEVTRLEREIDHLIFSLYELTGDEVDLVNASLSSPKKANDRDEDCDE